MARRPIVMVLALWCCLSLNAGAAPPASPTSSSVPAGTFQKVQRLSVRGQTVYFLPMHSAPIVDFYWTFGAGSRMDGQRYGLASLCQNLMPLRALAPLDIEAELDALGARLDSELTGDRATFHLRSLSEKPLLERAAKLFNAVVRTPHFKTQDLNRYRHIAHNELRMMMQSAASLSELAQNSYLFEGHPYAFPSTGTEESLSKISVKDLERFHRRYYGLSNGSLVIVGNLSAADAERLAAMMMASVPVGKKIRPCAPLPDLKKSRKVFLEMETEQTHLRIATRGVRAQDPDYPALVFANYIFGGNPFTSRLFQKIREERGLSYSVYSSFDPRACRGAFSIVLQSPPSKVREALEVVQEQLQHFVQEGPTSEEVSQNRRSLKGHLFLKLSSQSQMGQTLAQLVFDGRPLNTFDRFNDQLDALDAPRLREIFARHIHPEAMLTIEVGPKNKRAPGPSEHAPPTVADPHPAHLHG